MRELMSDPLETFLPGTPRFATHLFEVHEQVEAAVAASAQPALPSPDLTGTLAPDTLATLYTIAAFIGRKWRIASFSTLDVDQFRTITNLKTMRLPSYYTVYLQATSLLAALAATLGSE